MAKSSEDKPPPGGWLGPPNTTGLAPIATATSAKKGKWIFKATKLTEKQEKRHRKFQKAMKQADKDKEWSFSWK